MITGKELKEAGLPPGPYYADAIAMVNTDIQHGEDMQKSIERAVAEFMPAPKMELQDEYGFHVNMYTNTALERENYEKVKETMLEACRTPGVKAGAVMPDACPAGPVGNIPVGGVIASEYIHPGMHSADVCCSVACTNFGADVDPAVILDKVHQATHFGAGGREHMDQTFKMPHELWEKFQSNVFLSGEKMSRLADNHLGTQGDGNHFAFVGINGAGEVCLVTHHGSRAPGAMLYNKGMKEAKDHTRAIACDEVRNANVWLDPDTTAGEEYWEALQIMREWTKLNHWAIHDQTRLLAKSTVRDWFWNEHNFVFRKSDGLFYHGKGATPAFSGWADDATDRVLIPLNMSEPVLVAEGNDAANGLGFAPHGAGRNMSRTQHTKELLADGASGYDILERETAGIDARFYSGKFDLSELPSAYKNAGEIRDQIDDYGLANVVDYIHPYGCIMAGHPDRAKWKKKGKS